MRCKITFEADNEETEASVLCFEKMKNIARGGQTSEQLYNVGKTELFINYLLTRNLICLKISLAVFKISHIDDDNDDDGRSNHQCTTTYHHLCWIHTHCTVSRNSRMPALFVFFAMIQLFMKAYATCLRVCM